jgi:DNA-binding MarR family transcriptional regulator
MPNASRTAELSLPGHLDHGLLASVLGYHLAQASVPTDNVFKARIRQPFQLNKLEFTIVMLLSANTQVTPKRLCAALNIPASNLTLIIDRLADRDLVQRQRSEQDRRVQYIALSAQGQALAGELVGVAQVMEQDLLQHLSPAEQAMLLELLRKVAVHRKV